MQMDKKKVLVIDDEAFIRELVREFFELLGIKCEEAENWEIALKKLSEENYHLILLDRNLGDLKAETFIPRIKETSPDIPVVILTGDPQCDKKYLERIGAAGIIFKPFDVAEFKKVIAKFLENEH